MNIQGVNYCKEMEGLYNKLPQEQRFYLPQFVCKCNGERLNCPVCEYLDFGYEVRSIDPSEVNWSEAHKLMDEKFMAIKK